MVGELEIIKVVINGGSFALIVVFVLHYIFKAEPKTRDAIDKLESRHQDQVALQAKEYKETINKIVAEHKDTVKIITDSHERLVQSMLKECREERKEMMITMSKEAELNRVSRHDIAEKFQEAVTEMHELIIAVKGYSSPQRGNKGGT